MDNTQLGLLVGAMIAVNGSFVTLVVAFVNRSNGKAGKPYNGEERRRNGWHNTPCPSVTSLASGIEQVRTDIATLSGNLGQRINDLGRRIDDLYRKGVV